jgi:hypothetical protein
MLKQQTHCFASAESNAAFDRVLNDDSNSDDHSSSV